MNRDHTVVFEIASKYCISDSLVEKKRQKHLNAEFQRIAKRDKKAFFSDQCKYIEENNRMGKIEISSRKLGIQETPGVTGKFGLGIWNEAGQRLIEFCQENALVIANTLFQQHKRRLYTWTSPDGQHQNHIDYIL